MEVTIPEAKTQFSKLIAKALAGDKIIITYRREKKPVIRLAKFEQKAERRLNFAPEWPHLDDEAPFGSLPPKELAAWEGGAAQ